MIGVHVIGLMHAARRTAMMLVRGRSQTGRQRRPARRRRSRRGLSSARTRPRIAGGHAAPNRICQHCVDALGSSPVEPRTEHEHSASVSSFDTCSFPAVNALTVDTARRTGDWDQKSPVHIHVHTRFHFRKSSAPAPASPRPRTVRISAYPAYPHTQNPRSASVHVAAVACCAGAQPGSPSHGCLAAA